MFTLHNTIQDPNTKKYHLAAVLDKVGSQVESSLETASRLRYKEFILLIIVSHGD